MSKCPGNKSHVSIVRRQNDGHRFSWSLMEEKQKTSVQKKKNIIAADSTKVIKGE
jgi:hypothetical protein